MVIDGRIEHALRFTAPKTRAAYQWPARHKVGSDTSSALPPMGLRVRLKKVTPSPSPLAFCPQQESFQMLWVPSTCQEPLRGFHGPPMGYQVPL